MTFDQASVCVQREYWEWKYQKMSEVGWLAYRFSGVQSSSQKQSSWGNYNREKRVCTVSVNQWATNEKKKQDEEKCDPLETLRTRRTALLEFTEAENFSKKMETWLVLSLRLCDFSPFEYTLLEYLLFLSKLTEEDSFPIKLKHDLYYQYDCMIFSLWTKLVWISIEIKICD